MKCSHRLFWRHLVRALLLACVTLLGLVTIVGSGGGFLGFTDCFEPYCGPPGPPLPLAHVIPDHFTALVGTPVTFTATISNFTGSPSYRWSRSPDGNPPFTDIPGATGNSYTLPSVNLADDGAAFRVVVTSSNGEFAQAYAYLLVSATPGLVFEDGEFLDADWSASPVIDAGVPPPAVSDERVTSGGNPGAYRRMVFQVPMGTGAARVFYASRTAIYDPPSQGAIRVRFGYWRIGFGMPGDTIAHGIDNWKVTLWRR